MAMVRKKSEGNEEQRRAAARRARSQGTAPSALQETTGASKQRDHLPRREEHDRKIAAIHQGKQDSQAAEAKEAAVERATTAGSRQAPQYGPGRPGYTEDHEQVLNALAEAQEAQGGEAVYPDEIAQRAGVPADRVRVLLHDLSTEHRLVTQLRGGDSPDLGPRFEVKPRL